MAVGRVCVRGEWLLTGCVGGDEWLLISNVCRGGGVSLAVDRMCGEGVSGCWQGVCGRWWRASASKCGLRTLWLPKGLYPQVLGNGRHRVLW